MVRLGPVLGGFSRGAFRHKRVVAVVGPFPSLAVMGRREFGRHRPFPRPNGSNISKDWLDAFAAPEGRTSRFPNDRAGFRRLIAWIGSGVDRIAYEPSGPFHRDFEDNLLKAGLDLYAINPFQVRSSSPVRSADAPRRMPSTPVCSPPWRRPSRICVRPRRDRRDKRDLAELQQIRDGLRKDRVATINRGKHLRTPVGKRLNGQRLRQIERQLKIIDGELRRRFGEEKTLERRAEILTSIPGISDITAAGLIVHMPELGTFTGPRAASLAGLAPSAASPDTGRDTPSSRAEGITSPNCSTCLCWSPSSTIRTLSASTRRSWPAVSRPRSP